MKLLRTIAVGGFGHIVYADKLFSHPWTEPVAVVKPTDCDSDEADACRWLADKHGVPLVENDDDLMPSQSVDVCALMLRPDQLPRQVERLAARGIDVLSEKPIASDLEGARAIAVALERYGIRYAACVPGAWFVQPLIDARAHVAEGRIGTPLVLNATVISTTGPLYIANRRHYEPSGSDGSSLSGGELAMHGPYGIISLQSLGGPIVEVNADTHNYFYPEYAKRRQEDTTCVLLRFAGGAVGHLVVSRTKANSEPTRFMLDLTGTSGRLEVRDSRNNVTVFGQDRSQVSSVDGDAIELFIDDFVRAVVEKREPGLSAAQVLDAVAVQEAIYLSARTHAWEQVDRSWVPPVPQPQAAAASRT